MIDDFATAVLQWFQQHGRKSLPWQNPQTAYRVWLSEIMLQQTQVATVIPYFEKFTQRFPDITALANASSDEVLAHWAGLGYYSRARNLHRAAKIMVQDFKGNVPNDLAELESLPGIGRSTAGAILAQAFKKYGVILDGNVKRVLCRFHAVEGHASQAHVSKKLWQFAENHTPTQQVAEYTQAIMDMGSLICTRSKPKCDICPLQLNCQAYQTQQVNNFPVKKIRKQLPEKERFFALVVSADSQRLLLTRQYFANIWKGLWNLPNGTELDVLLSELQLKFAMQSEPQFLDGFRHTFSHFHLTLKPVVIFIPSIPLQIADSDNFCWVDAASLSDFGMPAPIKKLVMRQMGSK
jgi:A/G-specific adenine glycosylase